MEESVSKHFVTFYSPGTFVAEETERPIESWDVSTACEMAKTVLQRYGATPYGFRFTTRTRGPSDLDSKQSARSAMYYLGGKVRTLAEVKAEANPKERILLSNMEGNKYPRVIENNNSWRWTAPLMDDDVVLDWTPPVVEEPTA